MIRRLVIDAVTLGMMFLSLEGVVLSAPTDDGLRYYTDTHGATGVAWAMLELAETVEDEALKEKYTKCWKGALDWILSSMTRTDNEGRTAWYFYEAPEETTTRPVLMNNPYVPMTIQVFIRGYEESGDTRYKAAAISVTRWLIEVSASKKETEHGTAYGWSPGPYRPGAKSRRMLLSGWSHGLGSFMDTFCLAHRAFPDEDLELEEVLRGIVANLKAAGQTTGEGEEATLFWSTWKNEPLIRTGYCYGQAGITVHLLDVAAEFPDMRLDDGTTVLSMANANLRYLISVTEKSGRGYTWPALGGATGKKVHNPGFGSGTGGIGWAFLKGAKSNRQRDPAFADQCMKYARGAALFGVDTLLNIPNEKPFSRPGGHGVCGGYCGGIHFLSLFADEIRQSDPELVNEINTAIERTAELVLAASIDADGTPAWMFDPNHITLALDYGQTGVVWFLCMAARHLDSGELVEVAVKAGDFIVNQAVPAGDGYKFPRFVAHGGHPSKNKRRGLAEPQQPSGSHPRIAGHVARTKREVSAQLLSDLTKANGVLWTGPHCDDDLAVSGLLLFASKKLKKDTYVFTFHHVPAMAESSLPPERKLEIRIQDNQEFTKFVGLQEYVRFKPDGSTKPRGYSTHSPGYDKFFSALRDYILKKNIDVIVSFDDIQGWNMHPEHKVFSRELQAFLRTFSKEEDHDFSHYCVLNLNWKIVRAVPPPAHTDWIDMDKISITTDEGETITLWDGLREVLGIYQDSLAVCSRYYNNWARFCERTQHKEAYRKMNYPSRPAAASSRPTATATAR